MKLVIDSNIIIAALLRNSTSRNIILNSDFQFLAPDFTLTELKKYEELIMRKGNLTKQQLNVVFNHLFNKIHIQPISEYEELISKAHSMISDSKDVPFLALALAKSVDGIWTEDKHFKEQKEILIFSTKDLIERYI